jgi:hypothetical protein
VIENLPPQPEKPKEELRTALLLCGYVRFFPRVMKSHLEKIMSIPNLDIFFHTWDEIGYKNRKCGDFGKVWLDNKSPATDIEELVKFYKPKKYLMENNYKLLESFSLLPKLTPIFLYSGQAKDDASKYIKSQLYSIHKTCQLMEYYENETGIVYDNVIKLRFDYLLEKFDFEAIKNDCVDDILYFPSPSSSKHGHPGGGGGCLLCDKERMKKSHDAHSNDFCDLWFYGKRDLVVKACQSYLTCEEIMQKNHARNLEQMKEVMCDVKGDFVYIHRSDDLEKKMVCFYPERILREHLINEICCSSDKICGEIR